MSKVVRSCSFYVALIMIISMVLAGCTGKRNDANASEEIGSDVLPREAAGASIPKFEDIKFSDLLPGGAITADNTKYGYDDLKQKYTLSILMTNYGTPTFEADKDPICSFLQKKFNLSIKLETVSWNDQKIVLSTRFASGDAPDLFDAVDQGTANSLDSQGLLVDARSIYPYMPQWCKYTTKNMILYSYNQATGNIPFITHYAIQDAIWGLGIRKDWLKKFNMQEPKTEEELLAYAKACTFNDPDGNGKADTYFMLGGGGGTNLGMLGGFESMFGNPDVHVENGRLISPMFDGTRKKVIAFINKLNNENVLAPDWFTIDWSKKDAYVMNDKIGMVWYPAMAMLSEYTDAKSKAPGSLDIWEWYKESPIEGGKYYAAGGIGYMWGFLKTGFSEKGKLMRVAHMLDTMVIGGENYFNTIQGGSDKVYMDMGIKVEAPRTWKYNESGTFYYYNENGAPWNDKKWEAIWPWQLFGLSVSYQRAAPMGQTKFDSKINQTANQYNDVILSYDRWPNDKLLSSVDENEIAPNLADYVKAQEINFIFGKRPMSEWEAYQKEWLDKGGNDIIIAQAKKLNVPVPDYVK